MKKKTKLCHCKFLSNKPELMPNIKSKQYPFSIPCTECGRYRPYQIKENMRRTARQLRKQVVDKVIDTEKGAYRIEHSLNGRLYKATYVGAWKQVRWSLIPKKINGKWRFKYIERKVALAGSCWMGPFIDIEWLDIVLIGDPLPKYQYDKIIAKHLKVNVVSQHEGPDRSDTVMDIVLTASSTVEYLNRMSNLKKEEIKR